jgi:hypothetical protein
LAGTVYSATYCLMNNARQTRDHWNAGAAGATAGAALGLMARSYPMVFGAAAAIGGTMWLYDYLGGLFGRRRFATQEEMEAYRAGFYQK